MDGGDDATSGLVLMMYYPDVDDESTGALLKDVFKGDATNEGSDLSDVSSL